MCIVFDGLEECVSVSWTPVLAVCYDISGVLDMTLEEFNHLDMKVELTV